MTYIFYLLKWCNTVLDSPKSPEFLFEDYITKVPRNSRSRPLRRCISIDLYNLCITISDKQSTYLSIYNQKADHPAFIIDPTSDVNLITSHLRLITNESM